MIEPAASWDRLPPASQAALQKLRAECGVELPEAYLLLLGSSNGGEGELAVEPGWFQLWQAEGVLELNASYEVAEHAPGFFLFGSSGGGELLALDLRGEQPWKVVMLPAIPLEADQAVVVAEDFTGFIRAMGFPAK